MVLSAIFGAAHGNIINIFIQGVSGFMSLLLFLKCGGWQGRYVKALLTTGITHTLFNGVLTLIAITGGATST
ncbi:MAG: hypothetical protein A2676_03635 [Candidatus Sungbacteria bacterium RIFCSPHIGHO2_01_FULL_51_22]|nr:MAG: hypothetical protein A2676_03635 [Candidatus Sungbacteria bacterium RIFCSPHIGHO2_01_FULL_51_22]